MKSEQRNIEHRAPGRGRLPSQAKKIQRSERTAPSAVCVRAMEKVEAKMKAPRTICSARGIVHRRSGTRITTHVPSPGISAPFRQDGRRRRRVAVIEKPRELEPQVGARRARSPRARISPPRISPTSSLGRNDPEDPARLAQEARDDLAATAPPRAPARAARRRGARYPGGRYREQEAPWPGRRLPERTSRRARSRRASPPEAARPPRRASRAGA